MNKPKFRAWKKIRIQEMFNDVVRIDWLNNKIAIKYPNPGGNTFRIDEESLDNVILMQYTGLKDKNGVEICEGDILRKKYKSINYSNVEHTIEYAVFRDNTGAWRVKNPNKTLTNLLQIRKAVEVIGNIHANPELLNEVEK
ncbi:YopX family protein [Enterococcus caccae]|uniref:YopX protein domain-containing protein n=1 Tax=Enterococcus caccae ATCC BAA-1240 TaxID=1158612 RepID=R3TW06_9ENTE|nr:YopX family protein [Enterococcus caccae]EOL45789.1 hypothetical protein UC7_01586 [Enterococcus caccae ATCC BAA-1240]EOT60985.1 hypothetical protein I580_01887 [Enterococcus caccae ATCC BAA-1240]